MSNKTSDKNVANIEDDDVKMVHKIISFYKDLDTIYNNDKCKEIQALQNILAERDQDKKRIKELEEEIAMLKKASNIAKEVNIEDVTDVINKSCKEFMSNYIPKQVIIDKIKENIEILNKTNDGNLRERLYLENGIMKELLGGESK